MKKLITILTMGFVAMAQAQGVKVSYQRVIDIGHLLDKIPTDYLKEQVRQRVAKPKFYTLTFSGTESLFVEDNVKTEQAEEDSFIKITVTEDKSSGVYQNFSTGEYAESRNFYGKDFYIEDKVVQWKWNISSESKIISGYTCQKATATNAEGKSVQAWYATELALPVGPDLYNGLPGLIMELKYDNSVIFQVTNIVNDPLAKVVKPVQKGQVLNRAAFNKIKKERE